MEGIGTPPPLSLPLSDHSGPHCVQCKESGDLGSRPDTVTISSMTLGKLHHFSGPQFPYL